MASSGQIKGITIKIEGDTSGLAKDLQSVNSDIKKTNDALKDVEKALKLDPGNVELLAQKQDLLNKQIEQTSQKLQIEQQVAEKAKEALDIGTISQEEYATLTAEIATTESQLNTLGDAASASADSLEETGAAASDAGAEAEGSSGSFVNWGDAIKTAAEVAAGAIAAVTTAAAALTTAVVKGTKDLIKAAGDVAAYGDEVDKVSQKVGMTTEAYQKWDFIMQQNGSSMSENQAAFRTLVNAMDDARNGSEKAIEKFKSLEISLDEVKNSSREEMFEKVIMSLQNVTDETEKAALANDILGRSGTNLMPLLNSTNDELKALSQQAEDYGLIMSEDLVEDSAKYTDAVNLMQKSLGGLKNRVVGEFLPGLTQVADGVAGMAAGIEGSDKDIQAGVDQIVKTFEGMLPGIETAINTMMPVILQLGQSLLISLNNGIIENLPQILETATTILMSLVEALLAPESLEQLLTTAVQLIQTIVEGLLSVLDLIIEPMMNAIILLTETLLLPENIEKVINAAIKIITTVVQGLTKAMPKLIPAAMNAVLTIANTLLLPENINSLISCGVEFIASVIEGLIKNLPQLILTIVTQIIPKVLSAFGELGTELFNKAVTWGADLIEGLIGGIKKLWDKLKNTVKNVAGMIADFLGFSVPKLGPLSDFDKTGPDMIKLISSGIEDTLPTLQQAVNQTADVIDEGMIPKDYTGALNGISSQIAGIGGGKGTYIINVQVGSTTLAQAVISAQQMENYRSGGN